jgi:hypothetical protein
MPQMTITAPLSLQKLAQQPEIAKQVQAHLIRLGLLEPPVDGKFGRLSQRALQEFKSLLQIVEPDLGATTFKLLEDPSTVLPLKLGSDFASRMIRYMQSKKYFVSIGAQMYNVVYVEGVNADGSLNDDAFDQWNDRRIVIEIINGKPKLVGNWSATTEPGYEYTVEPMNENGAARIAFGQYKAWKMGLHGSGYSTHKALVQTSKLPVHRDFNQDGLRSGDKVDSGLFGINQHWGYDLPRVGIASAGCLVGRWQEGHQDFIDILLSDFRYLGNSGYQFMATVIPGDDLAQKFPMI